jgi:hypothetical protein
MEEHYNSTFFLKKKFLRYFIFIVLLVFASLSVVIFMQEKYNTVQADSNGVFAGGNYTVGATGCNYPSLTKAFKAIGSNTINGPVTFLLSSSYSSTAETFPIVIGDISGTSTVNIITIKPDKGVNKVIEGSSNSSVFKLNGTDNLIINGSFDGSNSRNLTIRNNSSADNTAAIWMGSLGPDKGCINVCIKNCNISSGCNPDAQETSYCIYAGNSSKISYNLSDGAGSDNDDIKIINNIFTKGHFGFWCAGGSNSTDKLVIDRNIFGSENQSEYIGFAGIFLHNVSDIQISNNTIKNIRSKVADYSTAQFANLYYNNCGILINSLKGTNNRIKCNNITGIKYTGSETFGVGGIEFNQGSYQFGNIIIDNNTISDLSSNKGFDDLDQDAICGIRFRDASSSNSSSIKLYYNSIYLTGNNLLNNSVSACLYIGKNVGKQVAGIEITNNIFANAMTKMNIKAYAFYYNEISLNPIGQMKYNCYYVTDNTGLLGFANGKTLKTFEEWQAATQKDRRSVFGDPYFTAYDNLLPDADYNGVWNQYGNGCKISNIDEDIMGNRRNTSYNDGTCIGAYEFAPNVEPPLSTNFGNIADNSTTDLFVGKMKVASITWHKNGGILPNSVELKYFSGKYPPDITVVWDANTSYTGSSSDAYWDFSVDGGSNYNFDITLYYDMAMTGTIDMEGNIIVAEKNDAGSWSAYGSKSILNMTEGAKYVSVNGLSSFNIFTLTSRKENPLPVSLVTFNAALQNNSTVLLSWTTASELNNDYFTIERSADCKVFEEISTIKGAGNSNKTIDYNYLDDNISDFPNNYIYYRLKQTDYNGKYTYSKPEMVKLLGDEQNNFQIVSVYPNPFVSYFYVVYNVNNDCSVRMDMYSASGGFVCTRIVESTKGVNTYLFATNDNMANGIYIVSLAINNNIFNTIKLYKQS